MNLMLQNNGADNTPLLWFVELNKTLFLSLFALVSKKACFTTEQIKQKWIPGILGFICNAFATQLKHSNNILSGNLALFCKKGEPHSGSPFSIRIY